MFHIARVYTYIRNSSQIFRTRRSIANAKTKKYPHNPESSSRTASSTEDTNSWIMHERRRRGFSRFSITSSATISLPQLFSRSIDNISRSTNEAEVKQHKLKLFFHSVFREAFNTICRKSQVVTIAFQLDFCWQLTNGRQSFENLTKPCGKGGGGKWFFFASVLFNEKDKSR